MFKRPASAFEEPENAPRSDEVRDGGARLLNQVIGEIASELKCEPDNEAILAAISSQSAEIARLREAIAPFADAAESLDDNHPDGGHLWEAPAALTITAGDLRRARAARGDERDQDGARLRD